jgi:hypothetical protein
VGQSLCIKTDSSGRGFERYETELPLDYQDYEYFALGTCRTHFDHLTESARPSIAVLAATDGLDRNAVLEDRLQSDGVSKSRMQARLQT